MKWFVRYNGVFVKTQYRAKLTVDADTPEQALAKARRRFWLRNPRLVEVLSLDAPPPLPSDGDEGRRWWADHGY